MNDLLGEAEDLGRTSQIKAIERLVPVAGLRVLDVGCGKGDLARQLAARRAETIAIEPDPAQAELNRSAPTEERLTFIEGSAQNLPVEDGSVDGIFFNYSLHHVPMDHMEEALLEAARALKPENGFLYVLEPLPSGSMDAVFRPFHDEIEVRTKAYYALKRIAPLFQRMREYRFDEMAHYDSFGAFLERVADMTYNHIPLEKVDNAAVRDLFDAGKTENGYAFTVCNRINLFRSPRT